MVRLHLRNCGIASASIWKLGAALFCQLFLRRYFRSNCRALSMTGGEDIAEPLYRLERLAGITVAPDFPGALASLDCGYERRMYSRRRASSASALP
jgi:hypothetical protein